MQGRVFTNVPNENKFECIDLTTGEILYTYTSSGVFLNLYDNSDYLACFFFDGTVGSSTDHYAAGFASFEPGGKALGISI
jgi:hypothetical protein